MTNFDFDSIQKIHFMGIGGISMSGLAEIALSKGKTVSGSDPSPSKLTEKLEEEGATIFYGQVAENITEDIDLLVYTAAIHPDNPEFAEAKRRGIPCLPRGEFLGFIMKDYQTAIGVSGTNGKTTSTSMLSHILLEAKKDPTIMVGGILPAIDGNLRIGHSDTFITEACEYTNSFLAFSPTLVIILNITEDHLDFFKDLDDIRHSFKLFAELLPEDGCLVINGDIENYEYITEGLNCHVITFGSDVSNNYSAANITYDDQARPTFDLIYNGQTLDRITLSVPGEHNVYNSLATIAAALELSISLPIIKKGLLAFTGTGRRFQVKGTINGATVIDDYAHNPDEIRAVLKTMERYPHNNLWCIFQPHTFSRTQTLMKEFAKELSKAEHVILADIYPARETDNLGISSQTLQAEIKKLGKDAYYFPSFSEIEDFIKKSCSQNDIVLTMGAGDVVNIGENLIS